MTTIITKTAAGRLITLNVTNCLEKFGFAAGDRIQTPSGHASVLGHDEEHLWCIWDGDKGATRHNAPTFNNPDIKLIYSPSASKITPTPPLIDEQISFVNNPLFSDVSLKSDSDPEIFYAHRVILSARSKYFLKMFSGEMKESYSKEPILLSFFTERKHIVGFLTYLYSGSYQCETEQDAVLYLQAASYYDCDILFRNAESVLIEKANSDNIFESLILAHKFQCESLQTYAVKFIVDHLTTAFTPEFEEKFSTFIEKAESDIVKLITRQALSKKRKTPSH